MASSTKRRPRSLADELLAVGGQGEISTEEQATAAEASFSPVPRALLLPIERIAPNPDNPRKIFEHLDDLAGSIAERGVLQPLVVRRDPARPGFYVTVAGARRLLAARIVQGHSEAESRARVATLPCVVMDETERDAFADALAENLSRQDLSRAEVMASLDRLHTEYGWSARYIARRTGRSVGDVAELLGIAKDATIAPLVRDEMITPTAAGQIRRLPEALRPAAISGVREGRVKTVEDVRRIRRAAESAASPSNNGGELPKAPPVSTTTFLPGASDIGHPGTVTKHGGGDAASAAVSTAPDDETPIDLETLAITRLLRARGSHAPRADVVQALRADLALLEGGLA